MGNTIGTVRIEVLSIGAKSGENKSGKIIVNPSGPIKLLKLFAVALLIVSTSCEKGEILYPVETVGIKLSFGCTSEMAIEMRKEGVHSFFLDKGQRFETARFLYDQFDGTGYAEPNFYFNGTIVRYWNGKSFKK